MDAKAKPQDPKLERAKRIIRGLQERSTDRGCSEAEAMEAADKIGQLLEQFNLTLSEVELREHSKMVEDHVYAADEAAGSMVTGIGRLCSLKTYSKRGQTVTTYVLYGFPEDIELAKYLYEVCSESLDYELAQYFERHGYSKAKRLSFRVGFGQRVSQRLTEMRAKRDAEDAARASKSGCTDLVLLKNQIVEQEFGKTGVKLRSTKQRVPDGEAYRRGHAQGSKVNLNSPLENQRAGQGAIR